ncbi:SH3 domain protein [Ceratobasidium sp. AG-Ba]|nr:SH3 domain protein [Ceratobasidium sp. AG-Ba]
MSASISYGKELPDQVPSINATLTHQLVLLADARELVKERVALEKEYALRLSVRVVTLSVLLVFTAKQAIAKKAEERRAKHMTPAVLGEECSKAWSDADVRGSTLDKAYTALLTSIENTASDHDSLASALSAEVADPLKTLERSKDESRKKQMAFFAKLVAERDRIYGERLKAKQKYDEECDEVETFRQKQDRATDDKHADRAAKQYDQQKTEMQNRKNAYLIQIAIANNIKDRFYDHELPLLEDHSNSVRNVDSNSDDGINGIPDRISSRRYYETSGAAASTFPSAPRRIFEVRWAAALNAIDPDQDQVLYASFNRRPFSKPSDWDFEPCDRYYDTPEVIIEPEPKVLLQNKLQRARTKIAELIPIIEDKSREVSRLAKIVESYAANPTLGNYDEVWENLLDGTHQLTDLELVKATHEAEMRVLSEALAGKLKHSATRLQSNVSLGDEGAQKPHEFKSTSFSIPAPCGYCKTSIWGLSKPGKTCKICGISVHIRCELKMPAECGLPPGSSSSKASSINRNASTRSTAPAASPVSPNASTAALSSPPRANSMTRPSAALAAPAPAPASASAIQAKVLYSYSASGEFEVSVTDGTTVGVVEPDDGSGWVKVRNEQGAEGLVPATYIEVLSRSPTVKKRAPPPPVKAAPSAKMVKALYSYEASGADELSLQEGATYELTPNGENYGDGWWEGIDSKGKKGIFPSNYVERL